MTFVIFLLLLLFFSLFSSSLLFTFIDCFKQALYRAFKCKKSISIKLKRMKQLEFSVDQRIKLRYHFFTRIFFFVVIRDSMRNERTQWNVKLTSLSARLCIISLQTQYLDVVGQCHANKLHKK